MKSTDFLPVILVRGFDPLATSPETTYYGFNDGTTYPHKLGEDYIYEGMLLKFLKTRFRKRGTSEVFTYEDATNAIRYQPYDTPNTEPAVPALQELQRLVLGGKAPSPEQVSWLTGPVQLQPRVAARFRNQPRSIWVYRYYDFKTRELPYYAQQLDRVIQMVRTVTGAPSVNLICHSMGGLVARYLIQKRYADRKTAERIINKWVTLGTPHRGIAFNVLPNLDLWELEYFNRERLRQDDLFGPNLESIEEWFDPDRLLCVVGTNHRTYNVGIATALNQLASWLQGQDQNHSDGLVKQDSATLRGAHVAHVFKCHGGKDSLVTSREAFELATRFFFGDVHATLRVREAEIRRRYDGFHPVAAFFDGKPEFYVGLSVKPRNLDFFLHQQDEKSENCFGPIHEYKLGPHHFRWDKEDRSRDGILFEGFFNSVLAPQADGEPEDLVFRLDFYVGERDGYILGHSDTVIVQQQSYLVVKPVDGPEQLEITLLPSVRDPQRMIPFRKVGGDVWHLDLDFGDLAPDFRINLELQLSWRQPE